MLTMLTAKHITLTDIFNDLTENTFNKRSLQEEAEKFYDDFAEQLEDFRRYYIEEEGELNEFRN